MKQENKNEEAKHFPISLLILLACVEIHNKDEATSALDNENESKVQGALDVFARRGSALVIAHRLSTIKDSDKIFVFDRGVVTESGSHSELLAKDKNAKRSVTRSDSNSDKTTADDEDRNKEAGEQLGAPPPKHRLYSLLDSSSSSSSSVCLSTRSASHDPNGHGEIIKKPVLARASCSSSGVETALFHRRSKQAASAKSVSYARLWNAAMGEEAESLSLEKLHKKIVDMGDEIALLRKREEKMLKMKANLLLKPAVQIKKTQEFNTASVLFDDKKYSRSGSAVAPSHN